MDKLNILILEDETVMYMHLSMTLKQIGCTNIYIAKTYSEALELASQYQLHIMFSDINISGEFDGIDTAKALQRIYNLAVVFITGHNDKDTLSRASEVEFIGYLLKPYRMDELQTLISIAINKYDFSNPSLSLKVSGEYSFDLNKNILYKADQMLCLTKKEQLFLSLLFRNHNSIILYSTVDELVWVGESVTDNTRRTFIYRIKKRFPNLQLHTINNVGIKLT